jgi:L-alanine-DL-glutamate epimerase-like enolase superfamily enzyme
LGPLTIRKVESFIIRDPSAPAKSEDYFVQMNPLGATTGGVGLWDRLDMATPAGRPYAFQSLLVKITTDQGIIGWGEPAAAMTPRVHQTIITDLFTPVLIGQDARNVEPLFERMYSTMRLRGFSAGYWKEAIAGIDIALWDILGKATNTPIWGLLGGKFRDKIPHYTGVGGASIQQLKENAQKLLEAGYTVMKMSLSKYAGTHDVERVAAVSDVLKGKGKVLVDSLGGYKLSEAIRVGRRLAELGNVDWWEDALLPEDSDGYARLAHTLDVPICAGEQYHNRFQFRDLFRAGAVEVINPDIGRLGITEGRRVANMADTYDILWSPHMSNQSILGRVASMHLAAATANFVIMEGGGSYQGPGGNRLLKEPLQCNGALVDVPAKPGLGVEFDEGELAKVVVSK